jgi:predicted unusual protein kinase regulating ubiquinone biosynthesis (AarF/ABC1/UbiB family)
MPSREDDRLSGRVKRVAQVGAGLSSAALAVGANRLLGEGASAGSARALAAALGGVKGPLMKVAQMLATVPDLLPPEYAEELQNLQTNAPPMGWSFVKRRMRAELGEGWQSRFARFEREAAHAASLGQVHRATDHDGRALAAKLQYPDMASAVEADLVQLRAVLAVFKLAERSIDPSDAVEEVGDRLREELDYVREAKAMRLYRRMLADEPGIRVPEPIEELSTGRLLTMTWLEGARITDYKTAPQHVRNAIAERLFKAWWRPMSAYGVIHGDPHLGNYAVAAPQEGSDDGSVLNLLDFGCIRIFPARFVEGVIGLYRALRSDDRAAQAAAYEAWGFGRLSDALLDALNLWARFIYGPILEDRERSVADGVSPALYGRREAFAVREKLRALGPVKIPREFVFMDRAAIGLGAAFLHLDAKLNFHRLFEGAIDGFEVDEVAARQAEALGEVGLGASPPS